MSAQAPRRFGRVGGRGRRRVVVALIGAAALIVLVASVGPRDAGHGEPDQDPFAGGSGTISSNSAASSVLLSPIRVESELGAAIIAGHIMCRREEALADDSVLAVQAAVAADNDKPPGAGGAPKPYAHDVSAQSEIVRASMQELHDDSRFFADCEPVPAAATETSHP